MDIPPGYPVRRYDYFLGGEDFHEAHPAAAELPQWVRLHVID
ncbi:MULTISPECIES: hypothetical protein [Nocardia]|nr:MULTISPECIES: hypothetical protein [Nocardia]